MAVLDLGKVVPEKGVDYFTEQDIDDIVSEVESEISVPTKTSDLVNDSGFVDNTVNNLTNYELKTNTGSSLLVSIDSSTYVMTMNLKNSAGTVISTQTVDLPLETMVIGASYDSLSKEIVLTLKNGTTTRFSVADLVSGLQTEITSTNKLSSDLVDDTNSSNKFVSASEKTTWNGKQNALTAGDNITIENNVISATGGSGETLLYSLVSDMTSTAEWNSIITLPNTDLLKLTEIIQEVYNNGDSSFNLIVSAANNWKSPLTFTYGRARESIQAKPTSLNLFAIASDNPLTTTTFARVLNVGLVVSLTWNGDIVSVTSARISTNKTSYLATENTAAFVPTGDYNPATKKYVDDAVASAGSSVPSIVITLSQIVSQDPIQISLTAEQQAIIEDVNIGTLIVDGSALGVTPAYCQKNENGSTDVLLAAFSFAWDVSSGFNISDTAIFAGHYDKQTHILTIVNTPLLGNTPTADNQLANKKYVDDAVAGAGGGSSLPIYILETVKNIWEAQANITSSNDPDAIARASEIINTIYSSDKKYGGILLYSTTTQYQYLFLLSGSIANNKTTFDFYSNTSAYYMGSTSSDQIFAYKKLSISGSWNNDVFTCTSVVYIVPTWYRLSDFVEKSSVLSKSNVTAFTPTGDYNPATKKYVDDAVASAGGSSTEFLDLSFFSPNVVDNEQNIYVASNHEHYEEINTLFTKINNGEFPCVYAKVNLYRKDFNDNQTPRITTNVVPCYFEIYGNSILLKTKMPNDMSLSYSGYGINRGLVFYTLSYDTFMGAYKISYYSNMTRNRFAWLEEIEPAVETKLKSLASYDATKTQILKNISGTLTWVDE